MSTEPNSAALVLKEIRGLTATLKDSIKTREPWDREIDFQRANLRRMYLQLIFLHPLAKESKEADHSLWMTTSYFTIAAYKQKLSSSEESKSSKGSRAKPVEHRKMVQRFRQFLADEDKFWTSFVARVARAFMLEDTVQSTFQALNIVIDSNVEPQGQSHIDRKNVFPSDTALPSITLSATQKEQKLIMLVRALVCLGDIARYREHYNERPRKQGQPPTQPRPHNYTKTLEIYERARALAPDVGNAAHQLAILAGYQQDTFASVVWYYRAMCIKSPYDTAKSNLDSTVGRGLDQFCKAQQDNGVDEQPRVKVERFKKAVVALHGLWRRNVEDQDALLPLHSENVVAMFGSLISTRSLPTDLITKTLVIAFGALWACRVIRDTGNGQAKVQDSVAVASKGAREARILSHILALLRVLLEVGVKQVSDAEKAPEPGLPAANVPAETHANAELALNITAVFRRTLPALRLGIKWISVNYEYLHDSPLRLNASQDELEAFWSSLAHCATLIASMFPLELMPSAAGAKAVLEEDLELAGYTPLKKVLGLAEGGRNIAIEEVHPNEEHLMRIREVEEAFRTLAAIEGSPVVVGAGRFVVRGSAGALALLQREKQVTVPRSQTGDVIANGVDEEEEEEPDNVTVSTRPEDDPVRLAMQAELSEDEDDCEEQVLYPKRSVDNLSNAALATPKQPKPITAEDLVNDMLRRSSSTLPSGSVTFRPRTSLPTVAPLQSGAISLSPPNQLQIQGPFTPGAARGQRNPPTSQSMGPQIPSVAPVNHSPNAPALLFGPGASPNAPPSIWSTAHDHVGAFATDRLGTSRTAMRSTSDDPFVHGSHHRHFSQPINATHGWVENAGGMSVPRKAPISVSQSPSHSQMLSPSHGLSLSRSQAHSQPSSPFGPVGAGFGLALSTMHPQGPVGYPGQQLGYADAVPAQIGQTDWDMRPSATDRFSAIPQHPPMPMDMSSMWRPG